ncbi:uncharacterized protein LOC107295141 [Protobothrops mucrosquamatus]|nr:uncharacterized protein LOC107295141 [Protobothrops mucrosquamatus]
MLEALKAEDKKSEVSFHRTHQASAWAERQVSIRTLVLKIRREQQALMSEAQLLGSWVEWNLLSLKAEYISGEVNRQADYLSRSTVAFLIAVISTRRVSELAALSGTEGLFLYYCQVDQGLHCGVVPEIRAQLTEQQKCLEQQTEMRVQLLQDLQDFFRKKADIETEYSRSLEKLAERFMAKTRSTKDHQQYKKDQNLLSPVNCWYLLLNQVRRESKDHATLSDIYLNNVIMRFMQISEDSTRVFKKSKEIAFQLHEDLMRVLNELYTVMKTYHMYHTESISAESKLKEAEKQEEKQIGRSGDPVFHIRLEERHQRRSSVKKIEKMKEKRQAKYSENKLKSIKARNEYLLTLEATNASVFKYYIYDLSDLIDCCDLGYHASLSRALRTYLSAEYNLETSRHEGLDIIENAVDNLEPRSDKQRFMEMYPIAFCPPMKFEFQPHMGDEVSQVSAQQPVQGEFMLRYQQLQSRLTTLKIENEEVKKTTEATLQTIQDMVTIEDYDVSECFQHSRSTESVKSTVSETYLSKPSIAKRRANQQETEQFYFMKFREYLEGSNLITKLQAKHDSLQQTLGEGHRAEYMTTSRGRRNSQTRHQDSGQVIPLIVESCIRFINLYGLQHQGIFRVSGSQVEVNDTKNSFERGENPLADDQSNHDINSVAGVLKLYFRGLENPIFPKERFNDLISCVRTENLYERALHIRKLLLTLPRSIIILLRYLFAFLNQWLSRQLQHLVEDSTTTVKSSQEFLQRLKAVRIQDDETVSFDVTSLFTSIPQKLAISTIKDLLQLKGLRSQGSLGMEDVIKLLQLCLKTHFTFQGTIYEQIKGTPMGSPILGIIAEVVLQCLEAKAMADYQPEFWARYVDDTFAIIKQTRKTAFMEKLNAIFPDIQFMAEEETNGSLAFLDVWITHQTNGALHTTVYRKATHTDRMLHYMSNHPAAHKISCMRTLFAHIDTHCSTKKARQVERACLHQVCRWNGYPTSFIRRYSKCQEPHRAPDDPGTTSWTTIPYVQGVSEATARILAPYNIKVSHRPNQTLRMKAMHPKEPLPKEEKSLVVYRVRCKDCQCNYMGETAKRIKTRIHEHRLAIRRQEQYSQIWTHMINNEHSFDFKGAEAIAQDASKGGHLLKEAWLSNMDSINQCIELPPAYQALRVYEEHFHTSSHSPSESLLFVDIGNVRLESLIASCSGSLAGVAGSLENIEVPRPAGSPSYAL